MELGLRYAGSLSMVAYRFQVGDLVRVQIGILPKGGGALIDQTFSKPIGGIYQVTRLMPPSFTGEPRYQIKGCFGQAERIVEQSFLIPAPPFAQPRY